MAVLNTTINTEDGGVELDAEGPEEIPDMTRPQVTHYL
jgi:hypothetical protein